jgi:hypothetical protein
VKARDDELARQASSLAAMRSAAEKMVRSADVPKTGVSSIAVPEPGASAVAASAPSDAIDPAFECVVNGAGDEFSVLSVSFSFFGVLMFTRKGHDHKNGGSYKGASVVAGQEDASRP